MEPNLLSRSQIDRSANMGDEDSTRFIPGMAPTEHKHLLQFPLAQGDGHFVASLDIGTTTLRCIIYDQETTIRGSASDKIQLLYPDRGFVEIHPDRLWESVIKVIREAIHDASLQPAQISCLGISTQRSSFTTWHKDTSRTFHNLVTWRDLRANKLVEDTNNSLPLKTMRAASKVIYLLTRNRRFMAGSQMKVMNTQVTGRLLWVLQNVPELKEAVRVDKAMFGTLDTWIVYKLTGGRVHATDPSNAACTGFFDPFTMSWASWGFYVLSIPSTILPDIRDTSGDFGVLDPSLLGSPIPIRSLVADQSAAMFGCCAFQPGDIKITLGTGSFLNVNTGNKPHASITGLYPIVGWKIQKETVYIAEGASNDTGTIISWAQSIGLFRDPTESAVSAEAVPHSDGLCFIPAFSGIQAPINDGLAAAGFIGVKPTTSRSHMVRSLLESIVFRVEQLFEVASGEVDQKFSKIRIDGGVSNNDFVVQLVADLTGVEVERAKSAEMSALGAAFLAGLSVGVWQSADQLLKFRTIDRKFLPRWEVKEEYLERSKLWRKGVERFLSWYPEPDY